MWPAPPSLLFSSSLSLFLSFFFFMGGTGVGVCLLWSRSSGGGGASPLVPSSARACLSDPILRAPCIFRDYKMPIKWTAPPHRLRCVSGARGYAVFSLMCIPADLRGSRIFGNGGGTPLPSYDDETPPHPIRPVSPLPCLPEDKWERRRSSTCAL